MNRAKPQANNDGPRSRSRRRVCIYTHLRDAEKIIGVQLSAVKAAECCEVRYHTRHRRNGAPGEVPLRRRDAPGGRPGGDGDGARRGGVRPRARGPGGAQAGPVRGGDAEPARRGAAELLRAGARHRAQPQVPLRRHAVRHGAEGRRQARRGHDHPQALRHRQPPRRLQMRPIYPAMRGVMMRNKVMAPAPEGLQTLNVQYAVISVVWDFSQIPE